MSGPNGTKQTDYQILCLYTVYHRCIFQWSIYFCFRSSSVAVVCLLGTCLLKGLHYQNSQTSVESFIVVNFISSGANDPLFSLSIWLSIIIIIIILSLLSLLLSLVTNLPVSFMNSRFHECHLNALFEHESLGRGGGTGLGGGRTRDFTLCDDLKLAGLPQWPSSHFSLKLAWTLDCQLFKSVWCRRSDTQISRRYSLQDKSWIS